MKLFWRQTLQVVIDTATNDDLDKQQQQQQQQQRLFESKQYFLDMSLKRAIQFNYFSSVYNLFLPSSSSTWQFWERDLFGDGEFT